MACINKTTAICVLFLALYTVFLRVEAYNQCYSDGDCSYSRYCCDRKYPEDNVCRYDCLGESCLLDSDCASGECCSSDDECKTSGSCDVTSGLAGWIVAVIIISILVVIGIPLAVFLFCCCCAASASRRRAHGGVIVTQPTATTVISNQGQPYPTQQGQPMYYQPNPVQPYPAQPYPAQAYPPQAYPTQGTPQQPTPNDNLY